MTWRLSGGRGTVSAIKTAIVTCTAVLDVLELARVSIPITSIVTTRRRCFPGAAGEYLGLLDRVQ
jgi:hypothetical protein